MALLKVHFSIFPILNALANGCRLYDIEQILNSHASRSENCTNGIEDGTAKARDRKARGDERDARKAKATGQWPVETIWTFDGQFQYAAGSKNWRLQHVIQSELEIARIMSNHTGL
jgi:hypothetical protein